MIRFRAYVAQGWSSFQGLVSSGVGQVDWTPEEQKKLASILMVLSRITNIARGIQEAVSVMADREDLSGAKRMQEIRTALKVHRATPANVDTFKRLLIWKGLLISPDDRLQQLTTWHRELLSQLERVLQVQRYCAGASARLQGRTESSKSGAKAAEQTELSRLNREILASEMLLGRSELSSLPVNLQIEPTNRCNAQCRTCGHASVRGWVYYDVNTKALEKISHVLSFSNFVEIFGYGEPSLAPSFQQIIDLCSQGAGETRTISNGLLLNSNPAFKRLNKIGISFDGGSAETFETIRSGISFDNLLKGIAQFREQNPSIEIYFVVTVNKANLQELPKIVQIANDLGLFAVAFHAMNVTASGLRDLVLDQSDLEEYRAILKMIRTSYENDSFRIFDHVLIPVDRPILPLNQKAALAQFKEISTTVESDLPPLREIIDQLSKEQIPLGPPAPLLLREAPVLEAPVRSPISQASSASAEQDRGLEALRNKSAALREEIRARGAGGLKIPFCMAPWYRLVVKAPGKLLPCCAHNHSFASLSSMGSFDEAWNDPFLTGLRDAFHEHGTITGRCKGCSVVERFQGLTELLHFLREVGLSYDEIPKHPEFNPPEGRLVI